jgi:hypothetical protein
MRKLVALFFLSAHLFSLGGYQLLFNKMEQQVGKQFIAQLDEQTYNDEELLEIKVPIELPYMQNWDSYERYDGEVIVDGVHYNYVKRKLVNDSMSFLCLPNAEKNRLYNARETFFALVNDIEKGDSQKESPVAPIKLVKQIATDYFEPVDFLEFTFSSTISQTHFTAYLFTELPAHLLGIERPPAVLV